MSDKTEETLFLRNRLLLQFEAWLDEVLAGEEPPEGIAEEVLTALEQAGTAPEAAGRGSASDLYSMWSAITALTQEVRLQGRSFKELSGTLDPVKHLSGSVSDLLKEHGEVVAGGQELARMVARARSEAEQEAARRAEQSVRRETIGVLLDLRDRLKRGLRSAEIHGRKARKALESGLVGLLLSLRRSGHPVLDASDALEKGYVLTLKHLNDVLARLGVHEIECEGYRFDPRTMSAVDIEETDRVPEGTVLEVYRPGYKWGSELFRPAEVKVARAAPGGEGHGV